MQLFEHAANLHMHTPYSDGEAYHAQIAQAALAAGLDLVCVTDHNVWVQGPERYYAEGERRVLLLVGEELHDAARQPQKNHLLAYNHSRELAPLAAQPQALIDAVRETGGLAFLAHPCDAAVPLIDYEAIDWVTWEVTGYTGLEIWNYMSDWARLLTTKAAALRYSLNPDLGVTGPAAETLARWDALTAAGQRVVGIGNSDAHATVYQKWGVSRCLFPYEFLFRQVNTHLLTREPLTGDAGQDRDRLMAALGAGHCFIGYDGIAPTRGFRFSASGDHGVLTMGDETTNRGGLTLQLTAPQPATLRLLRDGREIARKDGQSLTQVLPAGETGAFRAEAYLSYKGRLRGWIYSNPIYVRP